MNHKMIGSGGPEIGNREKALSTALGNLLDDVFAFKVGELVIPRAQATALLASMEINQPTARELRFDGYKLPTASAILERNLVQCHGGVQGFYTLRRVDGEGRAIAERYASHEVVSYMGFLQHVQEKVEAAKSTTNPTSAAAGQTP